MLWNCWCGTLRGQNFSWSVESNRVYLAVCARGWLYSHSRYSECKSWHHNGRQTLHILKQPKNEKISSCSVEDVQLLFSDLWSMSVVCLCFRRCGYEKLLDRVAYVEQRYCIPLTCAKMEDIASSLGLHVAHTGHTSITLLFRLLHDLGKPWLQVRL